MLKLKKDSVLQMFTTMHIVTKESKNKLHLLTTFVINIQCATNAKDFVLNNVQKRNHENP